MIIDCPIDIMILRWQNSLTGEGVECCVVHTVLGSVLNVMRPLAGVCKDDPVGVDKHLEHDDPKETECRRATPVQKGHSFFNVTE